MVALVAGLIAGYEEQRTRAGRPCLDADEARLTACHLDTSQKINIVNVRFAYKINLFDLKVPALERGVCLCIGDCFSRYHTLQNP